MLVQMKCKEFHQHFENLGDYFWIREIERKLQWETPERIRRLGPYVCIKFYFFLLAYNTDYNFEIYSQMRLSTQNRLVVSGIFVQLSKKPPYFCSLEVILK